MLVQELGRRWGTTDITPSFHWRKTVFEGAVSSRGFRAPQIHAEMSKPVLLWHLKRQRHPVQTAVTVFVTVCVFLRSNVSVNVFLALTKEMKGRKDEVTADIQNYKTGRQLKPASGVGTMAGIDLKDTFLLRIVTDPRAPTQI